MNERLREQTGAILVTVLMAVLALSVLGLATIYLAGASNTVMAASRAQDQALYIAEAGVNSGIDYATTNPESIAQQYATAGYGGTTPDIHIRNAGADVLVPGLTGNATPLVAAYRLGTSVDSSGRTVKCGLVGQSDRFGEQRFRVEGRGNGPGGAMREVEAHVLLAPREGLCPPGNKVTGGYSGG